MTRFSGLRSINHAGKWIVDNSDFPCLGGLNIISRFISPRSTASSFRAISFQWAGDQSHEGVTHAPNMRSFERAASCNSLIELDALNDAICEFFIFSQHLLNDVVLLLVYHISRDLAALCGLPI